MDTANFMRIAGYSNMSYAVLLFLTGILWQLMLPVEMIQANYAALVESPFWIAINLTSMAAVFIGIIGFFGYVFHKNYKMSIFSGIGLLMILLSLLLRFAMLSWEAVVWPSLLSSSPGIAFLTESAYLQSPMIISSFSVFTLVFSFGYLIFGVVSFRNKIFTKMTSVLLMFGALLHGFTMVLPFWMGLIGAFVYCLSIFISGKEMINGE